MAEEQKEKKDRAMEVLKRVERLFRERPDLVSKIPIRGREERR